MTVNGRMSVAQLRAFLVSAQSGSFTSAAHELGLSQASVSELVRRLEQEYRLVLFSRGTRRLTLTSAGHLLRPVAERILSSLEGADAALRAYSDLDGGTASFGVMRNAEYYLLPDLAEAFRTRHPSVRIRLIGQNSVQVADAVAAGELEAGIIVLPVDADGLDVRTLLRDEVVVVTCEPERYGESVTAAALATAPLILYDAHFGEREPTRRQIAELARRAGVHLEPTVEVEHVTTALRLVGRGIGDTFVSRAVTRAPDFPEGLHLLPFAEPLYDVIASVTRDAGVLSPASRELLVLAEEMILARSRVNPGQPGQLARGATSATSSPRPASASKLRRTRSASPGTATDATAATRSSPATIHGKRL